MCNKKTSKSDGAIFFCKECGTKYLDGMYKKGVEDTLNKLNYLFRVLGEKQVIKILRENLWDSVTDSNIESIEGEE